MKFKYKLVFSISLLLILTASCENYLEVVPVGQVAEEVLATRKGVNGLLIGAYSVADERGTSGAGYNGHWWYWGGVCSDDAHIGSSSSTCYYEGYLCDPSYSLMNDRWKLYYGSIQRTNDVLRILPKVPSNTIQESEKLQIEAEAKFLRAHYHFKAAQFFLNIPFVDEKINYESGNYYPDNSESVWPKIEADFKFAADHLTATKSEIGRANKWAAKAFLAQLYVTLHRWSEAKTLLDDIIANGVTSGGKKYALNELYWDNFRVATKNSQECIFTYQLSIYDGTGGSHAGGTEYYNGTYGGGSTPCCGMNQPSFDLVNAFQTDSITGLPLIDTYNDHLVKNDLGILSSQPFTLHTGTLDARLDHCVGRRGIPYLDWGNHLGKAWIRRQEQGGPYSCKKNVNYKATKDLDREGSYNNTPFNIMRYADVLLMAAECEVEIGSLAKAQEYVNMIRARAANPKGWVYKYIDDQKPELGSSDVPAANYYVGLYTNEFATKGKDFAREAVRFERRLELAMEGQRFWNLQRYDGAMHTNNKGTGYMAERLNAFLEYEKKGIPGYDNSTYMSGSYFTKGQDEVWPIPLVQIELSEKDGVFHLKQNNGY